MPALTPVPSSRQYESWNPALRWLDAAAGSPETESTRQREVESLADEDLLEGLLTLRAERRHWLGEHAKAVLWEVIGLVESTGDEDRLSSSGTARATHDESTDSSGGPTHNLAPRGTLGTDGTLPFLPTDLVPYEGLGGTSGTLAMLEHVTMDLLIHERVAAGRQLTVASIRTSEMVTAAVSSSWRVSLPEGVRAALEIERGHRVGFVVDDGALRVVNATRLEEKGLGLWLPLFGYSGRDTPEQVDNFSDRVVSRARALGRHNEPNAASEQSTDVAMRHSDDEQGSLPAMVRRAGEALGSVANAEAWLDKPNRAMDGQRPRDLLATDEGRQLVEEVLGRIEHGIYG